MAVVDNTGKVTIKGVGTANMTITAKATDNCKKASKKITVTVTKKAETVTDIKDAKVTGIKDMTYTGSALTQTPTVTLDGKALTLGTDYTVSVKR